MRLHHLRICAFGPFADTVSVDIDQLADAGLFLVHGQTGSGKTSILDAVCFALYAGVPGARAGSRSGLRSDHAAAGAIPQVQLDFTAGGRRLRVTRSPEYLRARRRGNGLRAMPATVRLEERRGGTWESLATRAQDVGLQINDVLGLGLDQFAKIVLLPQGEFAAFLQAAPDARRELLERLFDTTRMSDIEDWLTQRKRTLVAELAQTRSSVDRHLLRVEEILAGLPAPATLDDVIDPVNSEIPGLPAAGGDLDVAPDAVPAAAAWSSEHDPDLIGSELAKVVAQVEQRAAEAALVDDAWRALAEVAERGAGEAAAVDERQGAGRRAQESLAQIEAQQHTLGVARARLDAASRANALAGHLLGVRRSTSVLQQARRVAASARVRLGRPADDPVPSADLTELRALLDEQRTRLERAAQTETDLVEADAELELARDQLETAGVVHDEGRRQLAELELALQAATQERDRSQDLARTGHAAAAQLERLDRAKEAAAAARGSEAELARVDAARERAASAAVHAERDAVALRRRRLAGIAGELSAALVDGSPCAVCGSTSHPAPANQEDSVPGEQVQEAEQLAAARLVELQRLAAKVAVAAERHAGAVAQAEQLRGPIEVGDLAAAREQAAVQLRDVQEAAERVADLDEQLERARTTMGAESLRVADADLDRSAAKARVAEINRRRDAQQACLRSLLAAHASCPCASGPKVEGSLACGAVTNGPSAQDSGSRARAELVAHREYAGTVAALADAERDVEIAAGAFDQTRADLAQALGHNGFGSVAEAADAALPRAEQDELAGLVRAAERTAEVARAQLADPDIAAALEQPTPDLQGARQRLEHARARASEAHHARRSVEDAVRRLGEQAAPLRHVLADLGPANNQADVVARMADCVLGNGGDNRLRMRLSSYLLAARLEQVARLANERLDAMSSGRYALEYTDALAARGARSGLGLRVRDAWTGVTRETQTLSGGEAFMASLALALGLGEAVRMEAGGLDLQTLFVDEGFGSLDEESLEQVMAVLDGLRDGGRTVGIVSHVADLRQRIPAQIRVRKTAHGSTLEVTGTRAAPAA